MKILLSMKYLILPVNTKTVSKKVCLNENGRLIFDFDCKIDMIEPDFTAYVDVSRFEGRTVEISVEPEMRFEVGLADSMNLPQLYNEPLRPQVHFTVMNGWNNDPNGLIQYNGIYHMFYQYNPCAAEWGNMHWGHAISRDILHWEHKDIALFPDETGTMYSGSAIEDTENLTGLGKGAMLLYYTAAGERNLMSQNKKRTQCLAYSDDGGETFRKFSGNPVVGHIEAYNRDPKVVYVEELKKHLMIIYLNDDRYQMLTSGDLINWTPFQEIVLRTDSECPDIYPLNCNGRRLWVISGGSDVYVVGYFKGNAFIIENAEKKLTYSKISYATQSFSGTENGRVIRVAWDRLKIPCPSFASQMGFPTEMHLEEVQQRYYLAEQPVREIKELYADGLTIENIKLAGKIKFEVGPNPLDILMNAPYIPGNKLKLSLFGHELVCDMELNQITFKDIKMPVSMQQDKLDLRIIVDRCSLEVYADGGKFCFTAMMICDFNLPRIELSGTDGYTFDRFEYHILKSIYR